MVRLIPWLILGVIVALSGVSSLWLRAQSSDTPNSYRTYTATGEVVSVKTLGARGCAVRIRLHQWVSLSDGFALAEMPQRGQLYSVGANLEQCMALEVALASLASSDDLKSPHHIYYQAAQLPSGEWRMTKNPSATVGCGGL
jgi:hypothetical protein